MSRQFQRTHLRAPLNREILYVDDGYVAKCQCLNISEGGVLLAELPHVPEINLIPLVLELPNYPDFYNYSLAQLSEIKSSQIESKIYRVRGRIVRSFDDKSAVDKIFIKSIGVQFIDGELNFKMIVQNYVTTMAKNTIFLLNLFESSTKNTHVLEAIRNISQLFGHKGEEKLAILRMKILHDYQSLESR